MYSAYLYRIILLTIRIKIWNTLHYKTSERIIQETFCQNQSIMVGDLVDNAYSSEKVLEVVSWAVWGLPYCVQSVLIISAAMLVLPSLVSHMVAMTLIIIVTGIVRFETSSVDSFLTKSRPLSRAERFSAFWNAVLNNFNHIVTNFWDHVGIFSVASNDQWFKMIQ